MKKFTLFIASLFITLGAMAQDPIIIGVKSIPEKFDLAQPLETGYYLLKQVNNNYDCNYGNGVGWIKASREAAGNADDYDAQSQAHLISNMVSVTSSNTGTPNETGNLYVWYVEVLDKENRLIKISTANKVASWYLPANAQREKGLVAYASASTLQYHPEKSVDVNSGGSNTPKEGSAFISNYPVTSYIHFSGANLGSWTSSGTNSTYMVEFYKLEDENLITITSNTIAPTTGSYTKGGTWASEWTSNYDHNIKLASYNNRYASANNMTTVDGKMELWTGQILTGESASTSFYTLKVAPGYVIKGYSFDYVGKNAAEGRNVEIAAGNQTATSTAEKQTFTVEGLNSRSTVFTLTGVVTGEATDKNNGIIITDFKVDIQAAPEAKQATYAANGRLEVSDAPVDGVWADNTTWYLVQLKNNSGYLSTANVDNEGYFKINVTTRPNNCDERALWCVVGNETDGYRFYNKASGTSKVVYGSRVNNGDTKGFKMADAEGAANEYFDLVGSNVPVSGTDKRQIYTAVKDHNHEGVNNYWNFRNDGYLAYWNSTNALGNINSASQGTGSAFAFVSPENLEVKITNASETLNESGFSVDKGTAKVALQVQNENAAGYLKCNEPETSEGNIRYLIDGQIGDKEFFHSRWNNREKDPHYLEVDLGEGNSLSAFVVEYSTRYQTDADILNDFPDGITIKGSNDKENYTLIKAFNSGLPQGEGLTWTSAIVKPSEGYRYLRFEIAAERIYWHMSEFTIYSEPRIAVTNGKDDLIDVYENLYTQERPDIQATSVLDLLSYENNINGYMRLLGTTATIEDGQFYRIRNAQYENAYVYASLNNNNGYWEYTTAPGNEHIWQCEVDGNNKYLKNVQTASYMKTLQLQNDMLLSETKTDDVQAVTVTPLDNHQVKIELGSNTLHPQVSGNKAVAWNEEASSSVWFLDVVSQNEISHNVTIGTAGWSTLILGFNATIPTDEDFKAYTVEYVGDGYISLKEATGVLGANTPIIINAPAGDYVFKFTTEEADVTPVTEVLNGTLYNKYVAPEGVAYVLSMVEGEVGLYEAKLNKNAEGEEGTTHFKNNANKAYLAVKGAEGIKSYSFRFGEGTTGVEEIEVENGVKAIYDLTGRKVNEITAPGIYIVGGKKVLVK